MADFALRGSQRWLQVAVNRRPEVLRDALRRSGAIGATESVDWRSPLQADRFCEYRDNAALTKAGVSSLKVPLNAFWPARGPVWDAIGRTSGDVPIYVEAKAHIAEAASPATRASEASRSLIERSLNQARCFYAPKASCAWSGSFYQYANRLSHHYFLREKNGISSVLAFVYFVNAQDMSGPLSVEEWHGAVRLIHAVLGIPNDLRDRGVFDVFLDVRDLADAVPSVVQSREQLRADVQAGFSQLMRDEGNAYGSGKALAEKIKSVGRKSLARKR